MMSPDSSVDILRLLEEPEIVELKDLYLAKYGPSNYHYLLMYNQLKWTEQLKALDLEKCEANNGTPDEYIAFRKKFYTHREKDFRTYGTYISVHRDLLQSISMHTWEDEPNELFECLRETNLIEWHGRPMFTNIAYHLGEAVKDFFINEKNATIKRNRHCEFITMSHQTALDLDVPSVPAEVELKPLSVEHADTVHALWSSNKERSLRYVKQLIRINRTLGVFDKTKKELVAYVFQNDFAGLGILQVLPHVQTHDYGRLLARSMCNLIARNETIDISAWVAAENEGARLLLLDIGMETAYPTKWIQLK